MDQTSLSLSSQLNACLLHYLELAGQRTPSEWSADDLQSIAEAKLSKQLAPFLRDLDGRDLLATEKKELLLNIALMSEVERLPPLVSIKLSSLIDELQQLERHCQDRRSIIINNSSFSSNQIYQSSPFISHQPSPIQQRNLLQTFNLGQVGANPLCESNLLSDIHGSQNTLGSQEIVKRVKDVIGRDNNDDGDDDSNQEDDEDDIENNESNEEDDLAGSDNEDDIDASSEVEKEKNNNNNQDSHRLMMDNSFPWVQQSQFYLPATMTFVDQIEDPQKQGMSNGVSLQSNSSQSQDHLAAWANYSGYNGQIQQQKGIERKASDNEDDIDDDSEETDQVHLGNNFFGNNRKANCFDFKQSEPSIATNSLMSCEDENTYSKVRPNKEGADKVIIAAQQQIINSQSNNNSGRQMLSQPQVFVASDSQLFKENNKSAMIESILKNQRDDDKDKTITMIPVGMQQSNTKQLRLSQSQSKCVVSGDYQNVMTFERDIKQKLSVVISRKVNEKATTAACATYIINQPDCSINHVCIQSELGSNKFFLSNDNSTNGTYLDCIRQPAKIIEGTMIIMGDIFLSFNTIRFDGVKGYAEVGMKGKRNGLTAEQVIKITKDQRIALGRECKIFEKNPEFFADLNISRFHAELYIQLAQPQHPSAVASAELLIRDSNSTNGSWVRISKEQKYELFHNQVIKIGRESFLKIEIQ